MTSVFTRIEEDPQRCAERKCVEADNGVSVDKPRNAKECQQPPEGRREAWDRVSPRASRQKQPC